MIKALNIEVNEVERIGKIGTANSEFYKPFLSEGVFSLGDVFEYLKSEKWESNELANVQKVKGQLNEIVQHCIAFKNQYNKNKAHNKEFKAMLGYKKGAGEEYVLGAQYVNVFLIVKK